MGQRVAHLVRGRMRNSTEFDAGNAMARTVPPNSLIGRTLADAAVRSRFGVTVVGIKPLGMDLTSAGPESVVNDGDLVVISGERRAVERFSDQQ